MTDSPYEPPRSSLELCILPEEKEFYVVSSRKFIILYLGTVGLYDLYWFYRQWSANKAFNKSSIWPVIRALFSFIFVVPLFWKVNSSLKRQALGAMPYWFVNVLFVWIHLLAAYLIIVGNLTSTAEEAAGWFGFSVAAMAVQLTNLWSVQRKMNMAALDRRGEGNAALSGANWTWITIGSLLWMGNVATIVWPVPG